MLFLNQIEYSASYQEWLRDGPCEARQPVITRIMMLVPISAEDIQFREMRKIMNLFGLEEVFLF